MNEAVDLARATLCELKALEVDYQDRWKLPNIDLLSGPLERFASRTLPHIEPLKNLLPGELLDAHFQSWAFFFDRDRH